MVVGYAENGLACEALTCFKEMQLQGVKPNSFTVMTVIPECAQLSALQQGKSIHGYAIRSGIESDFVRIALMDMYAKCGSIDTASQLFDKLSERDIVSWRAKYILRHLAYMSIRAASTTTDSNPFLIM
eukprot:Gb_28281 [translate_table: standard]